MAALHLPRVEVPIDTLRQTLLLLLVQSVPGLADALLEALCRDLVVNLLHHAGVVLLRTHASAGQVRQRGPARAGHVATLQWCIGGTIRKVMRPTCRFQDRTCLTCCMISSLVALPDMAWAAPYLPSLCRDTN
jgi:hypothetical protein